MENDLFAVKKIRKPV